jgi:hypothetical protein
MRRENKIHARKNRELLRQHKTLVESERGWAGQHGQHPESEEEENYRPMSHRPASENENE